MPKVISGLTRGLTPEKRRYRLRQLRKARKAKSLRQRRMLDPRWVSPTQFIHGA